MTLWVSQTIERKGKKLGINRLSSMNLPSKIVYLSNYEKLRLKPIKDLRETLSL